MVAALLALGFFWAPDSDQPLRLRWWLPAAALTGWGARTASLGGGGFALWAASAAAGALLAVRAGSRVTRYILPEAVSEEGRDERRRVRRQLRTSVALFLAGYLAARTRPFAVALSAAFFVRYALLQAKLQGVPSVPLSKSAGIVPAQKWVVLLVFMLVGGTHYADSLLREGDEGPLLVTAALCSVLASVVFVLALVRTGWPRGLVRRTSFFAGIGLAVVLTAVLAKLESWNAERYAVFTSVWVFFLVVLPFVKSTTRLFHSYPRAGFLVPPAILAAMMAPVTAMNGSVWTIWTAPSTGALYAFAVLMLVYQLIVAIRERASGKLYLAASIGSLAFLFFHSGASGTWKIFFLSLGFALYSVDLFERVWRKSRPRERIQEV